MAPNPPPMMMTSGSRIAARSARPAPSAAPMAASSRPAAASPAALSAPATVATPTKVPTPTPAVTVRLREKPDRVDTGSDARFEVETNAEEGRCSLAVTYRGKDELQVASGEIDDGRCEMEYTLPKDARTGNATAKISVVATGGTATVDDEGAAIVAGEPTLPATGHVAYRLPDDTDLTLFRGAQAFLRGRVVDVVGEGVPGVYVDIGHSQSRVRTGDDGRYEVALPGRSFHALKVAALVPPPEKASINSMSPVRHFSAKDWIE